MNLIGKSIKMLGWGLLVVMTLTVGSDGVYAASSSDSGGSSLDAKSGEDFWKEVAPDKVAYYGKFEDKENKVCGESICKQGEKCVVKVNENQIDLQEGAEMVGVAAATVGSGAMVAGSAISGIIDIAVGVAAISSGIGIAFGIWGVVKGCVKVAMAAATVAGVAYTSSEVVKGDTNVTIYDYKCIAESASLDGYRDVKEGEGYILKTRERNRDIFGKSEKSEGICTEGKSGSYCLSSRNGIKSVVYNKADTAFQGCEVLPVKLYNGRKCFFCPLFAVMYKVANKLTGRSIGVMASAFAVLIAMGLIIWITMQTLMMVSKLTKEDAPKFITGLIKQSYKFVIAFFLLQFMSEVFGLIVQPILYSTLDFGDVLLESKYSNVAIIENGNSKDAFKKLEEENPGITQRIKEAMTIEEVEGVSQYAYYSKDLYVRLDNFIAKLQRQINFMQEVGTSLICIGSNAIFKGEIKMGSGVVMVIEGLMLAGFGFLVSLALAFYLVDAVAQLGILGALMPFFVASWPFKLTAKYTKVGWNMLLNSAAIFLFAGLIISIDIELVNSALGIGAAQEAVEKSGGDEKVLYDVEFGGLYNIAKAINEQNETDIERYTDLSSMGLLILLFACIFGFQFIGKISEMAGKFAGGALKPISPKIATMGGSAARSFALNSTKATREAAARHLRRAPKAVGNALVRGAIGMEKLGDKVVNKISGKSKSDKDGDKDGGGDKKE